MEEMSHKIYKRLVEMLDDDVEIQNDPTLYDEIVEDTMDGLVEYRSTSLKDFLQDKGVL